MDLLPLLEDLGIENLKEGTKEISGSCPLHPERLGRQDRHASWSINKYTGAHNCFSCGWKGNLEILYRDITGEIPIDIVSDIQTESLSTIGSKLREVTLSETKQDLDWHLPDLRPVPDKLREHRHLKADALDLYGVGWDSDTLCWVIPIKNERGEVIGAQYKQTGSFYNQPDKVPKSECLFGLDVVDSGHAIVVVESPLDAVRLYGIGIPAVALYGAQPSWSQARLLSCHFYIAVLAFDKDEAGAKGNSDLSYKLDRLGLGHIMFDMGHIHGKDPGDEPDDEVLRQAWQSTWHLS